MTLRRIHADVIREELGMSKVELARRARISESNLNQILKGRRIPFEPEQRRLSRALSMSVEEILKPAE